MVSSDIFVVNFETTSLCQWTEGKSAGNLFHMKYVFFAHFPWNQFWCFVQGANRHHWALVAPWFSCLRHQELHPEPIPLRCGCRAWSYSPRLRIWLKSGNTHIGQINGVNIVLKKNKQLHRFKVEVSNYIDLPYGICHYEHDWLHPCGFSLNSSTRLYRFKVGISGCWLDNANGGGLPPEIQKIYLGGGGSPILFGESSRHLYLGILVYEWQVV